MNASNIELNVSLPSISLASNEDDIVPTTEELLARTSSWTLACDNLLLNKLKKFSEDLEKTSLALNEDCQNLSQDATLLQAKLGNVTNQFLSLSSSQFVENRVQDFEEAAAAVSSSRTNVETNSIKKTKAEKEADLIAKMKKSIQIGISVNSDHFQLMSQETEQGKPEPFPHLIGSSKFFSSRYVGLVQDERRAIPSKISPANYQNSDAAFQSSNHSGLPPLETSVPKDLNIPVAKSLHPPEVSFTPSPTFQDVSKNISSNSDPMHQPLWNQSVITPPTYSNEPPSNAPKPNPISVQKHKQENYFNDDGPPPVVDSEDSDDDDFQPIVGAAGGGRLFADDDDEDIFNDSSLFPPSRVQNSFFSMPNNFETVAPAFIRASPPPPPSDEAVVTHNKEIFTSKPTAVEQSKIGPPPPVQDKIANSANSIYRSDDKSQKDGKGVLEASGSKKSKIPGGVSIFGSLPPTEIPKLRTQLNSKDEIAKSVVVEDVPETQLPKGNSNSANKKCVNVSDLGTNEDQDTTSHSSLTSRGLNSSQTVHVQQPKGIFIDDDSDDDLFSSRKPKPPSASSTHPSSTATFNGNLNVDPPPNRSFNRNHQPSKSKIRSSIFDDSDSDDDLFSSSSSTSSKITQKTKQSLAFPIVEENQSVSGAAVAKNRVGSSLFDNDSEESDSDLFISKGLNISKSKTKSIITTDTGVIGTSQTRPNHTKEPEVHDKTHLKVSTKTSTSERAVPGRDSVDPVIKMQAEPTEQKETENSTAVTDHILDKSTDSFNTPLVTEPESLKMSPPAPEKSEGITNTTDNTSEFPKPSALSSHNSFETSINPADDMKPPVVSPSESDSVFHSGNSDVPDKSSAVSVKKLLDAVPGSKISLLKERLSTSDLKVPSPIGNTNDDNNCLTGDKLKHENKIGKLKDKFSSDDLFKQNSPATDLSSRTSNTTDDAGKSERTGNKISRLKEKLSTSDSPKEALGSDRLSNMIGKPKVDVKKLALGLKINPLAMMPGAKLPKQASLESPRSETDVLAAEITPDSPTSDPTSDLGHIKSAKQTSVESPQSPLEGLSEISTRSFDNRGSDPLSPDKVDVKKLGLDLKINPLAMMPGAKPIKQKSLESPTTPIIEDIVAAAHSPLSPTEEDSVQNIVSSPVTESPKPSSPTEEDSSESSIPKPLLANLSKGRAKIQFKRRPPSKKLLHSCNTNAVDVEDDLPSPIDADTRVEDGELEGENKESTQTTPLPEYPSTDAKTNNQNTEVLPDTQKEKESNVCVKGEPTPEVKTEDGPTDATEVKKSVFGSEDVKPAGNSSLKTSIWDDSDSDDIFTSASSSSKRPQSKRRKSKDAPADNLTFPESSAELELPHNKVPEKIADSESKEELKEPSPSKVPEPDLQHRLRAENLQRKNLFSDDGLKSDDEDIFKSSNVPKKNDSGGNSQRVDKPVTPVILKSEVKNSGVHSHKQKKSKNPGLFDSDSDSDDLFKSSKHSKIKSATKKDASSSSFMNAKQPAEIGSSSTSKPASKSAASKKVIFDDSSDEDLFATKSKKKTVP